MDGLGRESGTTSGYNYATVMWVETPLKTPAMFDRFNCLQIELERAHDNFVLHFAKNIILRC